MGPLQRRLLLLLAATAAIFAAAIVSALAATSVLSAGSSGATVSSAGSATTAVVYPADGGNYTGMRPTGLGLPQIGASGTVGAGTLTQALNSYVSSGTYAKDLSAVAGAATSYLDARLAENAAPAQRICTTRFRRVHVAHQHRALFLRGRACHGVTPPRLTGKPAVVLDIDDTSLSNLQGLKATDYTVAGLLPAALGNLPAIAPTLAFYKDAIAHHVAVFFVTGRGSYLKSPTVANLRSAGYDGGYAALDFKPSSATTEAFKSSTRAAIQKMGYDVIVDMGDQESDLDGGHADRDFKLPNPFYFIAD